MAPLGHPVKVVPCGKAAHAVGWIDPVLPEKRVVAVGVEEKRKVAAMLGTEGLAVLERLLAARVGVDAGSLGLDHGSRSAFRDDLGRVVKRSPGEAKPPVDEGPASRGLVHRCHTLAQPAYAKATAGQAPRGRRISTLAAPLVVGLQPLAIVRFDWL